MSAQTMRRLVKLAYAKQEKMNPSNTVQLSANGKKKHIQRGKTMTNVRVQRGTSTEQKVAHRLSVTMNQQKQAAESLHIRSFSLPKEKTPQLTDEQQQQQQEQQQQSPASQNENEPLDLISGDNKENNNNNNNNMEPQNPKHASHPTITITLADDGNVNNNNNNNNSNNNNNNNNDNSIAIHNLPTSAANNLSQETINNNNNKMNHHKDQLGVNVIHKSAASDTHTTELSETVYTENTANTDYTKDEESTQYGYKTLKPNNQQSSYKGRGDQSLMSVASGSSGFSMSSYDSSQKKTPNVMPPALKTLPEGSQNNINTMKYADEELLGSGANNNNNNNNDDDNGEINHRPQQSVVQGVDSPALGNLDGDEDNDYEDDVDYDDDRQRKTRESMDLQEDLQLAHDKNSSIWSCLLCGCCSSPPSTEMNKVELVSNESNLDNTIYGNSNNNNNNKTSNKIVKDTSQQPYDDDDNNNDDGGDDNKDNEILQLDMDDWRTFKSAGSRIRRPTQYTTATNNEDSTINVDDVRMWSDPFGKGASGRVFKGLYLPLCQVMALKVTSRLDNDNVKQILGEFKQQQEFLPDCDELMRIHGWYRNLASNEIAVALEYMDMGSVYDSCFNTANNKSSISVEEQIKTGHKQIIVDKLDYDQIRFIARQCLLGLHALHSNSPPLIHRDIKPQNILLSSYGSVKIADFGLLIELKNGVCTDSKGTSKYFSPERIQGSFDTHCDIWSLGITLIEIYKQELISAEDLDWFKIVEDGIDIDDFLPATTPTEFLDFLKQCLQHQSEKRPTAKQLLSHKFITRQWGNPLNNKNNLNTKTNLKNIQIQFSKEDGDQKLLDKILSWLEEWILADAENNAKLFLEGDSEYLKQCVFNLSKYSGLPPRFIDRYIADLYRSYIDSN